MCGPLPLAEETGAGRKRTRLRASGRAHGDLVAERAILPGRIQLQVMPQREAEERRLDVARRRTPERGLPPRDQRRPIERGQFAQGDDDGCAW